MSMQVTVDDNLGFTCSCGNFCEGGVCSHVLYCQEHWDEHPHTALPTSADPTVIPIKGAGSGSARSYFYVSDHPILGHLGEFVRCMNQNGTLNVTCCSDGHAGRCWHVSEVLAFLDGLGTRAVEDDTLADKVASNHDEANDIPRTPYHMPPTREEREAMDRVHGNSAHVLNEASLYPMVTEDQLCACGVLGQYQACWSNKATVYLVDHPPCQVNVYEYRSACGRKECRIQYDGHKDGLFVYTKCTIFAARHFYDYGTSYAISGMSQEAYVKSVMEKKKFTAQDFRLVST